MAKEKTDEQYRNENDSEGDVPDEMKASSRVVNGNYGVPVSEIIQGGKVFQRSDGLVEIRYSPQLRRLSLPL